MSNVLGALLYLRIKSLQNATVTRLARLKQPKYLVGGIVGAAYFYFVLWGRSRGNRPQFPGSGGELAADVQLLAVTVCAVVLLIGAALCWLWSRERAALSFSEAEIAFLFPAPIKRRTLVNYRLLSAQLRVLLTALIFALLSSRWSFLGGGALIRVCGWWLIFATISMHITGSAFVLTRLLDRGVSQWQRQVGVFVIIALILFAATLWPEVRAPGVADLSDFQSTAKYLGGVLAGGPLSWLLLPAKWLIGPLFAHDVHSFLAALGPALLVYAAHYLWVLQLEVSFEEASIARAEKRAQVLAAFREGRSWRVGKSEPKPRRAPFDLSAVRRPELAFLWKNLLSSAEYLRLRTALVTAAIIVVGCTWLVRHPTYGPLARVMGTTALTMSAYALIFGPQIARQDLRSDLLNTDILKTYPLRGWQVVLGEILAPAAIVTALLWLMLLAAALTIDPPRADVTLQLRIAVALYLALLTPLLGGLQLIVVNAAALLFPAWLQTSRGRAQGVEVMGQRIVFLLGQLLIVVVALVPAGIAAAAVYFTTQWMFGMLIAAVLGGIMVLAVLAAEMCLGIAWLGRRFEKFDLSAELQH